MNKLLGLVGFVVCDIAAFWVLRVPATLPIHDAVGGLALILMGNAFDTFMRKLTVKQPRRPLRVVLLYWRPRRLTGTWVTPPIYAWLWWNYTA